MRPFDPNLLIPWGYGQQYVTLQYAWDSMVAYYEPEYLRRLFRWLTFKNGKVGIGGRHRFVQPDKPGFAEPGKSFHELQLFRDGLKAASAVDLVKPDGPDGNHDHDGMTVADAPQQGSAEARKWGVHINTSEAWHMQAVEMDGWQTWVNAGRKRPVAGYPIPPLDIPITPPLVIPPGPPAPPLEDDMTTPAVVSMAPGRIDIFERSNVDGSLQHLWRTDGQWGGWESLGGVLASAPDATSPLPNQIEVVVLGVDGFLYLKKFDGHDWLDWLQLAPAP